MASYVMAIDQGTTGTTVLVLDKRLALRAKREPGVPADLPEAGLGGARPRGHLGLGARDASQRALREARAARAATSPRSASRTSARRPRLWDRRTGKPLHHAIVWQDRRTTRRLRAAQGDGTRAARPREDGARARPVLLGDEDPLAPRQRPRRARAGRGRASSRSARSTRFLVWRLTGGAAHVTDVSNASRTLLMDLRTLRVGPRAARPVRRAAERAAGDPRRRRRCTARRSGVQGLPDGIPIAGHGGRPAGGAVRAGVLRRRARRSAPTAPARSCCRTSGPSRSRRRAACSPPSRGSVGGEVDLRARGLARFIAGAAVQWLRDGLGLIKTAPEVEALAKHGEGHGRRRRSCPALAGPRRAALAARGARAHSRASTAARPRRTSRARRSRASRFQIYDLAEAMRAEAGKPFPAFKVDGGASHERPAHAVPGGPARRAGRAAAHDRDDRARRRVPRRPRDGRLEGPRGDPQGVEGREAVRAEDEADRARGAPREVAAGGAGGAGATAAEASRCASQSLRRDARFRPRASS